MIVFRVLKRLVVSIYSSGCVKNALKEIFQVLLDSLACRNNPCLLRAGSQIPHNDHHERFDSFLQFPDLFFDRRSVLVKTRSFSFLCARGLFKYLPHTPQ